MESESHISAAFTNHPSPPPCFSHVSRARDDKAGHAEGIKSHLAVTAPSSLHLLDAIIGARVGVAAGFTATILRVFRKRGVAPVTMLGAWQEGGEGETSVCQALVRRARLAGRSGRILSPSGWR